MTTTTTTRRRPWSCCAGVGGLILLLATAQAKPSPSDYTTEARTIIDSLLPGGSCAGQAWDKLAALTDTVGNRVCGSPNLNRAVSYVLDAWTKEGLENVHGEEVMVPHWQRGHEECIMLTPRLDYKMPILGLGTSVGTPNGQPVEAEVIVVKDFDELGALGQAGKIAGKIVLVNYACDWAASPIGCYGACGQYRGEGASRAAAQGAVAYLVRSLASSSIGSPHTGMQSYLPDVTPVRIPAAAVTIEDADALARMQERGQNITLRLTMECVNLPMEGSMNVIAEWKGTEKPEEVVIVSGHLDSWDVGVGAMDDGGGLAISWQALSVLRSLGMRAKRTVRVVGWVGEEFGGFGGKAYFERHKEEEERVVMVVESDMGVFRPNGMSFSGGEKAGGVMKEVMSLLKPINASMLITDDGRGYETDTGPWEAVGVPGASLSSQNEKYFDFHHSWGDQMGVLKKEDTDLAAAVFAVVAFVVADLDEALPRGREGGREGEVKSEMLRRV